MLVLCMLLLSVKSIVILNKYSHEINVRNVAMSKLILQIMKNIMQNIHGTLQFNST